MAAPVSEMSLWLGESVEIHLQIWGVGRRAWKKEAALLVSSVETGLQCGSPVWRWPGEPWRKAQADSCRWQDLGVGATPLLHTLALASSSQHSCLGPHTVPVSAL